LNIILISINASGGLDEVGGGGDGDGYYLLLYTMNAICGTPVAVASVTAIVVAVLTCWPFRVYAYRSVPVRMIFVAEATVANAAQTLIRSGLSVGRHIFALFWRIFTQRLRVYIYLCVCVSVCVLPCTVGEYFYKIHFSRLLCTFIIYLYIYAYEYTRACLE